MRAHLVGSAVCVTATLVLAVAGQGAAQGARMTITSEHARTAAANGFTFSLAERQFGSRCFTATGKNDGRGMSSRSESDLLNVYAESNCEHRGLEGKPLQNGWRVRSVRTNQVCQFKDGNVWRALAGACTFDVVTTPAIGSSNAAFRSTVAVKGQGLPPQDRRARLDWVVEIEGPSGTSPWVAPTRGAGGSSPKRRPATMLPK